MIAPLQIAHSKSFSAQTLQYVCPHPITKVLSVFEKHTVHKMSWFKVVSAGESVEDVLAGEQVSDCPWNHKKTYKHDCQNFEK